jgi:hypothetical protein
MAAPKNMTKEQRVLRSRMGAYAMHAAGKTNTGPAIKASRSRFEKQVDPDGVLSPEVRAKRADQAWRAHMAAMSLKASQARSAKRAAKEANRSLS